MSDMRLFDVRNGQVRELEGRSVALEKSLQTLIENHLEAFLGVRLLASEYGTGKRHGGRIDTLGIDENGCPVIIEYKRATNENVMNQGLFYLDWLLDHKTEFQWLVMEKLGKKQADEVEWRSPRLICIAGDYTRYDQYAVQQINRNIELVRYRRYGDDFLLLDLVNTISATTEEQGTRTGQDDQKAQNQYKTVSDYLEKASIDLRDRYEALRAYLLALGDDVQENTLKLYFAFKRIKNFACVEVHPQTAALLVYLKVDPDSLDLSALGKDFARDVRNIGHFGTGDLEIKLRSHDDLEKAKPLLLRSYEVS